MLTQTPTKIFIYPKNTKTVTLESVVDQDTGIPWNGTAAITATLYDPSGNPVPGLVSVALSYVAASNGDFELEFGDESFTPALGRGYTLTIDGNQGGIILHVDISVEVTRRTS